VAVPVLGVEEFALHAYQGKSTRDDDWQGAGEEAARRRKASSSSYTAGPGANRGETVQLGAHLYPPYTRPGVLDQILAVRENLAV